MKDQDECLTVAFEEGKAALFVASALTSRDPSANLS